MKTVISLHRRMVLAALLLTLSSTLLGAWGDDPSAIRLYQSSEQFIAAAFAGNTPTKRTLWLRGDVKRSVARIMGHRYRGLRIRYWQRGARTAWILEEIGKERPITAGFVVQQGRIESVRVLEYRESRGWEVRYPFFLAQFDGAALLGDERLDRTIDSISGATLSVRAMTRMSRLALFLHHHVTRST